MKPENTKDNRKRVFFTCLTLCLLLFCLTTSPFAQTSDATAKAKPISPNNPLDEEGLEELLEELKESLGEIIEDEETQNSITEKWEARMEKLVGKTAKQVIDILLAEVKSVVEDEETIKKLSESWNSLIEETESSEPTAAKPENNQVAQRNLVTLDDKRKRELGALEMDAFFRQTGQVKAFIQEKGNYKGQSYTIYKDSADPNLAAKVAAVHRAIKTIKDKGVNIPQDLRVYCTNAFEAQNRAFQRDANWNPIAYIILGSAALVGGRADALSATGFGGFDKPTITTIHEIGHILHERSLGDAFWATGSIIAGKANTGSKVSGYAGQNKKEFIAEIFAGTIIGKVFTADVLAEYNQFSGPKFN